MRFLIISGGIEVNQDIAQASDQNFVNCSADSIADFGHVNAALISS